MVDLRTVRRVLALDLGMDEQSIESYLNSVDLSDAEGSGDAGIPLSEALRIVAEAEAAAASYAN